MYLGRKFVHGALLAPLFCLLQSGLAGGKHLAQAGQPVLRLQQSLLRRILLLLQLCNRANLQRHGMLQTVAKLVMVVQHFDRQTTVALVAPARIDFVGIALQLRHLPGRKINTADRLSILARQSIALARGQFDGKQDTVERFGHCVRYAVRG